MHVMVDHGMVELIEATRVVFVGDTIDAQKKTTSDLTK